VTADRACRLRRRRRAGSWDVRFACDPVQSSVPQPNDALCYKRMLCPILPAGLDQCNNVHATCAMPATGCLSWLYCSLWVDSDRDPHMELLCKQPHLLKKPASTKHDDLDISLFCLSWLWSDDSIFNNRIFLPD
jgi:hypothetical protein